MKRILLSTVCMVAFLGIQAQTYNYLTFQTASAEKSMQITGTVITFSNGNMVVKNTEEEYTVALSDLNKFYFTENATAIKNVLNNAGENVTVYTVSGQLVGHFDSKAAAKEQLSKGIYVVTGQGECKKMLVE